MLAPAHVGHQAFIRALIREGAGEGSFDRELATESPAATMFFTNLRHALQSGYFVQLDALSGQLHQRHVAGYVYQLPNATLPIGFGLFKEFGGGTFELWLIAISAAHRRQGHGRKIIEALLGTPAGRLAHLARVNRHALTGDVATKLLCERGFVPRRTTPTQVWLVHRDAPPGLLDGVTSARVVQVASD